MEVLISLIATLFVVGVLIMAFVIASTKMIDTLDTTSTAVTNETLTAVSNSSASELTAINYYGVSCSIAFVTNATTGDNFASGNWTTSGNGGCALTAVGDEDGITDENWNVSYVYTTPEDADASLAINQTSKSLSEATDWFDTFIVIGAVVVLVLLIVLVILAIRRAGLMGGGQGA